ncbi:MAG TPA: hypothetical protein PK992_13300, partial [Planctomycetaceae bacterium]|nr:hypothetical protein [Planctomycetaceae bacterium]
PTANPPKNHTMEPMIIRIPVITLPLTPDEWRGLDTFAPEEYSYGLEGAVAAFFVLADFRDRGGSAAGTFGPASYEPD